MQKDYSQRNFTIKAVVLSIILAILLAASNAYLALKIATTISASIPAAVLSIGIFRLFKHYSVFECNLAQTAASAGEGIAAAVAFVLPAMIILHLWTGFDYWLTTAIVAIGGLLGVFLCIPLRRVLLSLPDLKYPEGTAIGNVLKVSTSTEKGLLKRLLHGIFAGGAVTFLQQGLQVFTGSLSMWFKAGTTVLGMTLGFDAAAFAAGFIIGPEVCISLALGLVIGWVILIPALSHWYGIPAADNLYDSVMILWSAHLRYVGVGTMLVGGLWTLIKLIKPLTGGLRLSAVVLGRRHLVAEHERDIPMLGIGLGVLIFSALLFGLLAYIFHYLNMPLSFAFTMTALMVSLFFIMCIGFLLAMICGYITGVVGSTNNPISGLVIISIILLGLIYLGLFGAHTEHNAPAIVGLIILIATVIAAVSTCSNENMQDLKAGQMIGATPWKQQIMLGVGIVAASFVVAPILELLYNAYGMGGVFPRPGMDPSGMLAAPQASLMATVATGIITHKLAWTPILLGIMIAVGVILFDELVCRRYLKFRISIIGVGASIYLPSEVMTPMIIGGLVHFLLKHFSQKRTAAKNTQKAVEDANITACGIVAGSALMGVILAVPFVLLNSANALALSFTANPHYTWLVDILGIVGMLGLIRMLLKDIPKRSK